MVWKKSNIKKTDKDKRKLHNPYHEDAKPILKSCLKHTLDASSDPESSKEDSHGESGGGSSTKDHGLSRSVASRLSVSTNSSRSVDSRRVPSVEQLSCTDDSSIDIPQYSQNRERTSQAGPQHEAKKKVRFNAIQIRDYERVVGDNPSCTSGPPLSCVHVEDMMLQASASLSFLRRFHVLSLFQDWLEVSKNVNDRYQ